MGDRWASHLVGSEVLGEGTLPEQLERFLAWQTERWPRLAEALAALQRVELREIPVADRVLTMQWNPGRTTSSTAKVDAASVQQRRCFLCADSLPPEEHGVAFGDDLVVLPNPAPILPGHLVAAHREHVPQAVREALGPLIRLAAATQGASTVVYNGPKCGASAPDHLHLQAVASGRLPEERLVFEALQGGAVPGELLHEADGLQVWSARGAGRAILGFHGLSGAVEAAMRVALDVLGGDEPMVNVLATARGDRVVAMLFPRGAHRPACFFAEGPDQRVVSPGVIDMAGIVVAVREEDFRALDGAAVQGIFDEVSVTGDALGRIEQELARRLSDG
jgi:hypothetical protein